MALDDKFYPNDDAYLTRFDNAMIRKMGEFGEAYQNVTGNSYEGLVRAGYCVAVVLTGASLIGCWESVTFYSCWKNPPIRSPLEEEIVLEACGFSRYFMKGMRALDLFFAPLLVAGGYDGWQKITSPTELFIAAGVGLLGAGVGVFSLTDYLAKSHIPKPPKESAPKKLVDALLAKISKKEVRDHA